MRSASRLGGAAVLAAALLAALATPALAGQPASGDGSGSGSDLDLLALGDATCEATPTARSSQETASESPSSAYLPAQ
jgi:hypothetical protein